MFNNDMFSSPEKCIQECDKQIEFSKNLLNYLQQYIQQMEALKTMASSAKVFAEANPLNVMLQMMKNVTKDSK